ncbi:MAG: hypothetical protein ACLPQY_17415 [Streptosporangiaceae bacterium]
MEGRAVVRRWKFVVVEAANEDQAQEIAGQIMRVAPAGTTVRPGAPRCTCRSRASDRAERARR